MRFGLCCSRVVELAQKKLIDHATAVGSDQGIVNLHDIDRRIGCFQIEGPNFNAIPGPDSHTSGDADSDVIIGVLSQAGTANRVPTAAQYSPA